MKTILKNCIVFLLLLFYGCNENSNSKAPQISTTYKSVDCSTLDTNRTDIECTSISVPDNYLYPSTKYTMPVVRRMAIEGSQKLTPIIYLAGGPGESFMPLLNQNLTQFTTFKDRDILLHEQRGTGYFEPYIKECTFFNKDKIDAVLKNLENTQDIYSFNMTKEIFDTYLFDLYKEAYDTCKQDLVEKGQSPKNFSSRQVAYDIESIRQSFGYDKIILKGGSYGTRYALEYLELYPQNLEAVILDGVSPENIEFRVNSVVQRKNAIEKFLNVCQNDAKCSTSYPNLKEELHYIADTLHKTPYEYNTTNEKKETVKNFINGLTIYEKVFDLLYGTNNYKNIPYLIHNIYVGLIVDDYTFLNSLTSIFEITVNNTRENPYFSNTMSEIVWLNDFPLNQEKALNTYDNLGEYQISYNKYHLLYLSSIYESYEGQKKVIKHNYENNVPILLLSGSLDPATTVKQAKSLHERLKNATHLIFNNKGHIQGHSECGQLTIEEFIANPNNFLAPSCVDDENHINFL